MDQGELPSRPIRFWYNDGATRKEGVFDLPPSQATGFKSCYLFSFPKAGSVLANNLLRDLMSEAGVPLVELPSILFGQGIDILHAEVDYKALFVDHGYCFGGWRAVHDQLRQSLDLMTGPKVIIVRDPRDMLVSRYFSLKYSHDFPEAGTEGFREAQSEGKKQAATAIDEFCRLEWTAYRFLLPGFKDLLGRPDTHVARYEDFIYDKAGLAKNLRGWFGLPIDDARLTQIAARYELVPKSDQPLEHIRQVHPGDHRRKLQPETIGALTQGFSEFLTTFGYE